MRHFLYKRQQKISTFHPKSPFQALNVSSARFFRSTAKQSSTPTGNNMVLGQAAFQLRWYAPMVTLSREPSPPSAPTAPSHPTLWDLVFKEGVDFLAEVVSCHAFESQCHHPTSHHPNPSLLGTCYAFAQPTNGQITYSINSQPYPIGTQANLQCYSGYNPIGSTNAQCLSTGWSSFALGTCIQNGIGIGKKK